MNPYEENLINIKKTQFLEAVERASMCIGVGTPYVNFDGCDFNNHECAHIHVEENIICVPDYYLKVASKEDLEKTAVHEVAHILNQTHDVDFHKKRILLNSASWKPPNFPYKSRRSMDEYEKRELSTYIEADIRKWSDVRVDENGDEYFLKGRKGFKKLLKDEIPYYVKPEHLIKPSNETNLEQQAHKTDWVDIENKRHNLNLSNISLEEKTTKELTEAIKKSEPKNTVINTPSKAIRVESKDEDFAKILQELHTEAKAEESNKYLPENDNSESIKIFDKKTDIISKSEDRSGYKLFAIIIGIFIILSFAIFVVINSNNNTLDTSKRTIPVTTPVNDIQQNPGSPIVGTWKFENTRGIVSTIVFDKDDNAILDGKPFKYSIVGSNLILKDNKSSSAIPYKLVDGNNLLLKLRVTDYDNYVKDIKNPVVTPTPIVTH